MNLKKLKSILDHVVENPKIKDALNKRRESKSEHTYVSALLKILGMVGIGVAFFGGRTAKKIEAVVVAVGLLIELSILVKETLIDDPEVQKMVRDAWEELSKQSSYLYKIARNLVPSINPRRS